MKTEYIVKLQHALPFSKYLEILFYRNTHAKFSMNLDFTPFGTASHRGLFFSLDVIGFTFFFSLFGGLLPYWMMDQKKVNHPTTHKAKPYATNVQTPTQMQLDKERAEGEGMGDSRHQPDETPDPKEEANNKQRFWEQN